MRTAFAGMAALMALLAASVAQAQDIAAPADTVVQASGADPLAATAQLPTEADRARDAAARGKDAVLPISLALAVGKDVARPPLPPPITLTLKVDLAAQRVTVMERGEVKGVWPISSGRAGYATQTGTFQPQWASKMWYSRQWDMAPMPHAVFFNGGTAFHATQAVGSLGRPASHGCVRLSPANAAKLYALVHRHGMNSTKVVVYGSPKEPAVAKRKGPGGYQGYASASQQARAQAQRGARNPSTSIWGF